MKFSECVIMLQCIFRPYSLFYCRFYDLFLNFIIHKDFCRFSFTVATTSHKHIIFRECSDMKHMSPKDTNGKRRNANNKNGRVHLRLQTIFNRLYQRSMMQTAGSCSGVGSASDSIAGVPGSKTIPATYFPRFSFR